MTPNEYQTLALKSKAEPREDLKNVYISAYDTRQKPKFFDMCICDVLEGVLGLSGESGECEDLIKKSLFQGHILDTESLAKELGDVAWYLAITAEAIGYGLETIFQMNLDKINERYPNGFDPKKSIHRKD